MSEIWAEGLQLHSQSPFLNTGVKFAFLQSSGTPLVAIRVMASANSVANSFKNLVGMRSGPSALLGSNPRFNPCSNFPIPSLLTVKVGMSGNKLLPIDGRLVEVSLEKTLLNWPFRIVTYWPFRIVTYILGCL